MIHKDHYFIDSVDPSRKITLDINFSEKKGSYPIAIFCHGFKGFKDWGAWNLVAKEFAQSGISFLKFNFSHNGISNVKNHEMNDLEGFGNNNFKLELDEIGSVLDWVEENKKDLGFDWNGEFYLIGHSRGGATAILRAARDARIQKLCTWASISSFQRYLDLKDPFKWEEDGAVFVKNSRTGLEYPLNFQIFKNYFDHIDVLDVKENLSNLSRPYLIIHGEMDEAVSIKEAEEIYQEVNHSIIVKIPNANHTFGTFHPFDKKELNSEMKTVVEETIEFFNL